MRAWLRYPVKIGHTTYPVGTAVKALKASDEQVQKLWKRIHHNPRSDMVAVKFPDIGFPTIVLLKQITTEKPVVVKHSRSSRDDYRHVSFDSTGCIKIKHKFNESLKNRLFKQVRGTHYFPDPIDGGYYLLPMTKESALAVLKFGIENDYKFSRDLLLKLDQLSRGVIPTDAVPSQTP